MLSIKEIDNYFVGKTSQHPEAFKCGVSNFADVCTQAKAYVSLVEKIKKLEFEFISSSRNSSPTQSSNKGWNSALREIKSFIDELGE